MSPSSQVLLSFLAVSAVFLLLARAFVRTRSLEIWAASLTLVLISSVFLRVLSDAGLLLDRTPVLVHAGFAGLILLWATVRRETSVLGAPAAATIRSGAVSWLVALPGAGALLSLPALWSSAALSAEIIGLLQMTALGVAWLITMRRTDRSAERSSAASRDAGQAVPGRSLRIFVCYRREDSADVTGRLYDRLVARFGRERVFKDVDSVPLGVDFRTHLQKMVGACDVVVAVIGERWLSAGGEGVRRLDNVKDFVRIELETALQRQIPVVPVLVGGARMPAADDLPATLAALAYRQGQAVRSDPDFHRDMDRLIQGLETHPLLE
jgi:hypothetical protein